jgi:hypothetical protein
MNSRESMNELESVTIGDYKATQSPSAPEEIDFRRWGGKGRLGFHSKALTSRIGRDPNHT